MIDKIIAFQGVPGAYAHAACLTAYPSHAPLPCAGFEEAFAAVRDGQAQYAMLPIENSIAGRVADIHHLLPEGGLYIVGEHFEPIRHCLLGLPGTVTTDIKYAHSHAQALTQSRQNLRRLNITPVVEANTALAAQKIAAQKDRSQGAIASDIAAAIYGLDILERDLADKANNTTRFVVMAAAPLTIAPAQSDVTTAFVFRMRSIPAALYKALGGFATNGINITKLESYMLDGSFSNVQFYMEVDGHYQSAPHQLAFDELKFFTETIDILGVFSKSGYRQP